MGKETGGGIGWVERVSLGEKDKYGVIWMRK